MAITPEKARKILEDGRAHGKPLTEKQRKFFGKMASRKKSKNPRRAKALAKSRKKSGGDSSIVKQVKSKY